MDLRGHHQVLDILLREVAAVEHICILLVGRDGVLALGLAEEIDDEVVCDAGDPRRELARVGVSALLDCGYRLDESLLEDVVGHILVLHNVENVVEHTVFVPAQQSVESFIVSGGVGCDQLFVGKPGKFLHFSQCSLVK